MGQNDAEQPKRRLVAKKAPDSHAGAPWPRKPQWQVSRLAVKGELGTREEQSGHKGDKQSGRTG